MNLTRTTLREKKLKVALKNNNVMVYDAHVTTADVAAPDSADLQSMPTCS